MVVDGAAGAGEASWPGEEELRLLARPPRIPGPDVLEVTSENVNEYNCGSWELVERDLGAVFPASLADTVLTFLRSCAVPEAFRTREELVNYKKVMLHVHQRGADMERQLCQLASFFHEEKITCSSGYSHPTERRGELTDALMQCRGGCEARYDARWLGKMLCNVPRHPAKGRGAENMTQLPRSFRCWKLACVALAAHGTEVAPEANVSSGSRPAATWHADLYEALQAQPWPAHVRTFVEAVLICRGADKALRIRDELAQAEKALELCVGHAEDALAATVAQPAPLEMAARLEAVAQNSAEHAQKATVATSATAELGEACTESYRTAMSAAMRRQRNVNLLSGSLPPLREALKWLHAIEEATATNKARLFVAGDPRELPTTKYGKSREAPPVFCVPAGFQGGSAPEDYRYKEALEKYGPQMRAEIASRGWPPHICSSSAVGGTAAATATTDGGQAAPVSAAKSAVACSVCDRRFQALWVRKSVCYECEESAREEGCCPFSRTCRATWFCPHGRRCLKCDSHSCDACRFSRGDGEHVRDLAAQVQPARICLDFDRTLASTRSGGMPLVGRDSMDPELRELLWDWRDQCCIVTRNSHVQEIGAFLVAMGAPDGIPVHSLKKPRSKAEFVLAPGLGENERIVFVDDTLAELTEAGVASDARVHRVLFVRGLL